MNKYKYWLALGVIGLISAWQCAAAQAIAPQATASRQPAAQHIGDATTALLDLQVSGSAAAPVLPMLGAAANLSWRRYLDSFNRPIPEFFNNEVGKTGSGQ
jgi:hypothetical protein